MNRTVFILTGILSTFAVPSLARIAICNAEYPHFTAVKLFYPEETIAATHSLAEVENFPKASSETFIIPCFPPHFGATNPTDLDACEGTTSDGSGPIPVAITFAQSQVKLRATIEGKTIEIPLHCRGKWTGPILP